MSFPRHERTRPAGNGTGSKIQQAAGSSPILPATTHVVPDDTDPRITPLNLMTEEERRNVLWYSERARSEGWLAGYDHAIQEHWRLPSYEDASTSIIALGTVGIDRREAARRREVAG